MAEVRRVNRDARYPNPELFRYTGSMEGLPEWVDPVHVPGSSAWQRTAQ